MLFRSSVEIDYINRSTGRRKISIINGFNVKTPIGSIPEKRFQIQTDGYQISNIFTVRKLISKFSNNFVSDVLNVYRDFDSNDVYKDVATYSSRKCDFKV